MQGCDASILLGSNEFTITSEMESSKNFGIKQRETFGRLKSMIEMECSGARAGFLCRCNSTSC